MKSKWFWIICTKNVLPFSNLNNEDFLDTIKGKNIKLTHVTRNKMSHETEFFNQEFYN